MNTTIIYRSRLFSKQYAVLLDPEITIPPSSLLSIYSFKGWRYLEGGNLVDFSSIPINIKAFSIDKNDIDSFYYVYTGAIVLAYFKNNFKIKNNLATEILDLVMYMPKDWNNKEFSIIQLDYCPGRIFNYNEKTYGTDISNYTKIELGSLEVPTVEYRVLGNNSIKNII